MLLKIASGEWRGQTVNRGKRGRPSQVVALSSLPKDLQLKWAASQRAQHSAEVQDAISPSAKFSDSAKSDDQLAQLTRALSSYPADERDAWIAEALRLNDLVNRYEAINPKRIRACPGQLHFVPAVKALCKEAVCTNQIILDAFAQRTRREPRDRRNEVSPHTLDGWARNRRRVGLLAFIRSKPSAKRPDDGRLADLTPAAGEWLETRWRRYPIVTQLYEKWKETARKNRWKIPSLAWLQRRWKEIPPVTKTAIFKGDKSYTDKYKPFLARTAEDLEALQLLCGDHHVLDVICWSEKLKELVRLWLTGWQDVRTSLIWGAHLDYTPSSFTIGCAYANGVRTFGAQPPSREGFDSYIYTDNGKDYRSYNIKGEIEVHQHAAAINGGLKLLLTQRGVGLANAANVKTMLARNFNGREKPYERTGGVLADMIESEFFNRGWCGRNTKDKPDACRDLYARHLKAIKRGAPSPFPPEEEVRIEVFKWIERYNTSKHTRVTLGGATIVPIEEYNRLYTTRFEIRQETLALMVMKAIGGPLRKNGVVALGSSYWHDELSKWKGRRDADSRPLQLEVRYIDSDYTTAWIVLPDGAICEAQRVDLSSYLTPNKESLKAYAARSRSERELNKNHQLLQQSIWRGETVEDRIVAEFPVERREEERLPIAVGEGQGQARVHLFNRFDAKRHRLPVAHMVTAEQVSSVEADEGIFSEPPKRSQVKQFDFETGDE